MTLTSDPVPLPVGAPGDLSMTTGISKPPSGFDRVVDRGTRGLALAFAAGTIALLVFIIYEIGLASIPAVRHHGLSLITSDVWDVNREYFGLRSPVLGTIYSSCIALLIASIFGVAIAIFLSQNFIPRRLEVVFKNIVELLAAIPSVVYGLWGIFVVIPLLRPLANSLGATLAAGSHFFPASCLAPECCRPRWCWRLWSCPRSARSLMTH